MVIVTVKFKSGLPDGEAIAVAEERADAFRAVPGLLQKYYLKEPATGELCGLYIWESHEALAAFRESALAKSIPAAYQVLDAPRIEVFDHLLTLRPETG